MPLFSALPLLDFLPSLLLNYLPNILTSFPPLWCFLGSPWVCIPLWNLEHQWRWWTVLELVSTLRNIPSNYPPKSHVSFDKDLPQISLWGWGEVDQSFVSWISDCLLIVVNFCISNFTIFADRWLNFVKPKSVPNNQSFTTS